MIVKFRDRVDPNVKTIEDGSIETVKIFVLSCEGAVTEKNYFEGIELQREALGVPCVVKIECIETLGNHPTNLIESLENIEKEYDLDNDELCIVADRDVDFFQPFQYPDVKEKCEEKGYGMYISNPCFEFWLLLHFKKSFSVSELIKIQENKAVSQKYNYVGKELSKLNKIRSKSIDFNDYKGNIAVAIENANEYPTDLTSIEDNVGTNVGGLISKILNI